MKIVVLLKQTPDTEAKIILNASNQAIETKDIKYIINPYDEFAIEEALKIKDKDPSSEVVLISFAGDDCKERILKGLAMGADRGILVSNAGLEDACSLTVAKILAKAVKEENPQLVLCGKQGIDADNMHVGVMLAELMGWPHVNVVTKLTLDNQKALVEREIEGGQVEVYEATLPLVLGAHKSLNTPRYASLPGIMKAKKKPLVTKTVKELGLEDASLKSSQTTQILSYKFPPQKPKGKVFKDEPVEVMVDKVLKLLREEAKVL